MSQARTDSHVWLCKYGLSCSKNKFCEASSMHLSLASSNSSNPCCTPPGQQSADAMRGQDSLQTDTPQEQKKARCKASMQDVANRQDTSKPIGTDRWAYVPKKPCVTSAGVNHLHLSAVTMLATTSGMYSSPQDPQLPPRNLDRQQEHALVLAVTVENTAHSLDTCARCLHMCM